MKALKELLNVLKNGSEEEFCNKYTVVEEFIGRIERDINPFTFEENGTTDENGEHSYTIYDSENEIVFEAYFLDVHELEDLLEEELELEG